MTHFYKLPKKLSDLKGFFDNPMIQFKEEVVDGVTLVTPVYMIANADLWKIPYALELRGHVYRKDTGELISAALPKFFNVGENEYTMKHVLPWDKVDNVSLKVDGSLITFAIINGKVYAKTKKSFYSDVAKKAQHFLETTPEGNAIVCEVFNTMRFGDYSPIYEFFHPEFRIVINYGDKPSMKFLGNRDMVTGQWIPKKHSSDIDLNDISVKTIGDELEFREETEEGIEGYVIQFEDGRIVKSKNLWYKRNHHVKTDLRERDIAELAALEQLDDVKSTIVEAGMELDKVEEIESLVAKMISGLRVEVEEISNYAKIAYPIAKDAAIQYKNHPLFGMIMRSYRDQEVDYVDYFLKNYLKSFNLICVYNPAF